MLTLFCIFTLSVVCVLLAVLGRLGEGMYENSVYIPYLADRGVCKVCVVFGVVAVVFVLSNGRGRIGGV